jgi:hypothetical protein
MKNILSLTAVVSALFLAAPAVSANEFVTLSNFGDSLELKSGETALVVSASQDLTVQYEKTTSPTRKSQFKLAASVQGNYGSYRVSGRAAKRYVPSWTAPFLLSGPCKVKLVTSGVVGMRVVKDAK